MNYYELIFKRKSFHIFRDIDVIPESEIYLLNEFIQTVKPLDSSISFHIEVVKESFRGSEYSILFYSEEKGNYLRNMGYIGEQIDLYCASRNIGSLWYGIGKCDKQISNMKFVIMICIGKVDESRFRKDMFKAKRKPLEEIWSGEGLNVSNIVRFAPSACNTQPWQVENKDSILSVYRYRKMGKRGIMPKDKVIYYNRIDVGIFLFMLETCLEHEGIKYTSHQYYEDIDEEKVLIAEYKMGD